MSATPCICAGWWKSRIIARGNARIAACAPATQISARYRMLAEEIVEAAQQAVKFGYGTVVLQGGEDYRHHDCNGWRKSSGASKAETPLAVTLSLGERTEKDLAAWREAGADRYLLRFETSDRNLFDEIHPPLGNRQCDRIAILRRLKQKRLRSRQRRHGRHSRPDLRKPGERHRACSANWTWT